MSVAVYVAVEKAIAGWLRTDATIASLCGGAGGVRVFADGLPPRYVKPVSEDPYPRYPYVELLRVGGQPDPGGVVPLDNVLLQANCLGASVGSRIDVRKSHVEAVMAAVRSAVENMAAGVTLGTPSGGIAVVGQGGRTVRPPRFLPPSSGDERPRYDADFLVTVIAVPQ